MRCGRSWRAIARHLALLHAWLDALLAATRPVQADAASDARSRASPSAIDTRGT